MPKTHLNDSFLFSLFSRSSFSVFSVGETGVFSGKTPLPVVSSTLANKDGSSVLFEEKSNPALLSPKVLSEIKISNSDKIYDGLIFNQHQIDTTKV